MESNGGCFGKFFLIVLLPLLFVFFLGANFFGFIDFLSVSSHTFYITVAIFLIFLLFIPHNAFISFCKIKNQLKITQNELEKNLEKTALAIEGRTKSVLSVRDFLEDYFKNIRNDNFAKIASSTFPMLGILGTFIAIAISMPDFTVNSTKELDKEISTLLAGIGTAFYASIFGIFLSLLWSFFERIGLSQIENLTISLEEIYSKYIWSKKELLKFKYDQKTILDSEFIKALKDVFNLDFIKDLNKEHLQSYEKIINMTKDSLVNLEQSLQKASEKLNKNIQELHMASNTIEAKETLEQNLEQFNKSAKELKDLLISFDNGLDGALEKIDSEVAKSISMVEQLALNVKKLKE